MLRIYPAGPFSWQQRIKKCADQLAELGYIITGEWLTQDEQYTNPDNSTIIRPDIGQECQTLSERDILNIIESDTLILFEPGIPLERNTRVAEFGLALGLGKQCIVIGPEDEDKKDVISSIFVHLHDVTNFSRFNIRGNLRREERRILQRVRPVIRYQHWDDFLENTIKTLNPSFNTVSI